MIRQIVGAMCLSLLFPCYGYASALTKDAAVAVMDFGTRPGASTYEINLNNAKYASSECMIASLVNKHCFQVMDKDLVMNQLKAEQLNTTGLIDPDTAKRIGEILHTRYIIYGNVANVSVSDTGAEVMGGFGAGLKINVCTVRAHIIARVMDVETGDILMAVRGEGASKSSFINIKAGHTKENVKVLQLGTQNVTMDSVYNAIAKAADDIAGKMEKQA